MKKFFLFISMLLSLFVSQAQVNEKDSVVNIVSYFQKGDTVEYSYDHQNFEYKGKDTLYNLCVSSQFRLVVLEESKKGYRIEYTPLSYSYAPDSTLTPKGKLATELAKVMEKKMGKQKAIFVTNELGKLQRVENYKEISKSFKASIDDLLKELYGQLPQMEKVVPKSTMRQELLSKVQSEADVLSMYEEVQSLFSGHGIAFKLGETTAVDEKSKTTTVCARDRDEEYGTDDDYMLYVKDEEGVSENSKGGSQAKGVISQLVIRYWVNGWPKELSAIQKVQSDNGKEQRTTEVSLIEWTRHAFKK